MSECVKHPGQDTMVPCLGCGRSFCRICEPPQGSGLYCSNCYQEQLERFGSPKVEKVEPKPDKKPGRLKGAVSLRKPGKAAKGPEATSPSRSAGVAAKLAQPFRWIGARVSAAAGAVKKAFVRAGKATGKGATDATLATGRGVKSTALELKDHFPIGLVRTDLLEGDPPLTRDWPKLLGIVIGGALVWTVLVALTHVRSPGFSIGVAVIIAWAAVWVMGKEFGVKIGIVTAGLVLVSLAFGELAVQLLYRAGFLIKKLDLVYIADRQIKANLAFYRTFAFRLVIYRMLPAAVLAFLIGWWPLKLRPAWVGSEGRSHQARKLPPFKKRAEVKRPGGASGKANITGAQSRKKEQKATVD